MGIYCSLLTDIIDDDANGTTWKHQYLYSIKTIKLKMMITGWNVQASRDYCGYIFNYQHNWRGIIDSAVQVLSKAPFGGFLVYNLSEYWY